MQAAHEGAFRLAAARGTVTPAVQPEDRSTDWSRVTRLASGTTIVVEFRGGPAASRVFVHADASELIVLDLADSRLPRAAQRVLQEMAANHPDYLVEVFSGLRFDRADVHVGPDGVFLAERKVAALSDVLERVPRKDVVVIKTPPRRRGSLIGAAIGAAGGFVLGYASAVRLAYKQCNGSCSDEQALMALSLVGLPIAGGWLGYQANSRTTEDVIYRAPVGIVDSPDLTPAAAR